MRVGVIEVGHWHSGKYINRAVELGLEIVAVSDRNLDTARQWANQLGCPAYTDYAELLAKKAPEFVFAHGAHCEMTDIAETLVEHGTPFVMEKPMGVDWRRLAAVADKADDKGLFAGVDLPRRCFPLTRELLRLKETGELGCMTACSQRLFAGKPQRYHDWNVPWVLNPTQAGGGPLFNFGPHVIDTFLLLSGQNVKSVYCKSSRVLHGLDVEDYSAVLMATTEGALASFEVGYVCPDSMYDLSVSLCTDRLFVSTTTFDAAMISFRDGRTLEVGSEGEGAQLDYVAETLHRLEAGDQPVATIRDMVRALQIINAAVASAATDGSVTLE